MLERWRVGTLAGLALGASHFHICFLADLFEQSRLPLWVDELIHRLETFEGVLAVEDTGFVEVCHLRSDRMRRPKRRLMAAPPTSTGILSPRRCSSLMISGICLEVETSNAIGRSQWR